MQKKLLILWSWFYSLGSTRENLDDNQKQNIQNYLDYFLKSFASRLSEYTNLEIGVFGKEVLNKNYTIVNSLLIATTDRPEVKLIGEFIQKILKIH